MLRLSALLALLSFYNCTTQTPQEMSFEQWASIVQTEVSQNVQKLPECTQWLEIKPQEEIQMTAFIKIHPTGKLETLVLSDSQRWGKTFYECVFNSIDRHQFTAYSGESSIEVEQPLVFIKREN